MPTPTTAPASLGAAWGVKPAPSYNAPAGGSGGVYRSLTAQPRPAPNYSSYANAQLPNNLANRYAQMPGLSGPARAALGNTPQPLPFRPSALPAPGTPVTPAPRVPAVARSAGTARAAGAAGVVLASGIGAGIEIAAGGDPYEAIAGAAGSTAGGLAGAVLGGAIGSLLGPIGTFAGAQVGATLGAFAGNWLGRALMPDRQGFDEPYQSPGGEALFVGGQMEGVAYNVSYQWRNIAGPGEENNPFESANFNMLGPIQTIKISGFYHNQSAYGQQYPYYQWQFIGGDGSFVLRDATELTNIVVTRLDGQPDTGGNPPGYGQTVQPSTPTTSPSYRLPPQVTDDPTTSPPLPSVPAWPALLAGPAAGLALAPFVNPFNGPGPERATAPALNVGGLRNSPPGGSRTTSTPGQTRRDRGPVRPPQRTRQNNRCGCNRGIALNLGNQLSQNAGMLASAAEAGAILAKLNTMQAFAEKAWNNTRLQKLINLLTLIGVMHNAAMISREIGETMGYVASNALAVVGIKDEEGNALDVNQLVGESVANFVKSLVGEEAYTQTVTAWQKSNRILMAASNIVWTIRSIHDTTQDVLEWTAENTGKIGNALKKFGVVGERAYPWMSERVRAQDKYRLKFRRAFDGLEQLDDTASSLAQVTSEVREIQEESGELFTQIQNFKTEVETINPATTPSVSPENTPIATAETTAAAASQSPDVTVPDAAKGSTPDAP